MCAQLQSPIWLFAVSQTAAHGRNRKDYFFLIGKKKKLDWDNVLETRVNSSVCWVGHWWVCVSPDQ